MRWAYFFLQVKFIHSFKTIEIMTILDLKIRKLLPWDSIVISKTRKVENSVERSADGKKLRFVRTYPNGSFVVYKETGFYDFLS